MEDIIGIVSVWALPAILAITLHEAAHGFVAWRLGDATAYRLGRVSFNPLRHVHPFGTILLPLMLLVLQTGFVFGFAKPVPVNFNALRHPRRDMVWVAAAGPGINLGLAVVSAALMHLVPLAPDFSQVWLYASLQASVTINVLLAVFNMLPLPPLDGGRVAVGLLPRPMAIQLARLERVGIFLLLGLLLLVPILARELGYSVNIVGWLIVYPMDFVRDLIYTFVGFA